MGGPKKPHIPNFRRIVTVLAEVAVQETEAEVSSFADSSRVGFVNRVKRQGFEDFNAAPLNPEYRAAKIKAGLDPRVMIRTRHYLDSIQVFREHQSKYRMRFRVGFDRLTMAQNSKGKKVPYPLWKLARVHEYGSVKMHIPRRRHWKPYYDVMRGQAPGVRKRVMKRVRTRMKKRFPAVFK